jgi:hypothetical protein
LGALALSGLPGGTGARTYAAPAQAEEFAHPAFQRTWERTDRPVALGEVQRSFYWGPAPNTPGLLEDYAEGLGGKRLVQYFDKSRMEINDPNADQSNPFFVTNGLLTTELISGKMQVGNSAYVDHAPADIPLASDTDDLNAPTYVSFQGVSNTPLGDHPAPNRIGQFATSTINKAGELGTDPTKANDPNAQIVFYDETTRHNIPKAFWDFLNQTGPVYVPELGSYRNDRLSDPWFYATGLPISGPYWAKVKIANVPDVDVMIQAFERRVVTYVPSFPASFRVQMSNIGQHYYDWRYEGQPPSPPPLPTATSGPAGPPPTPTLNIAQPGAESLIGTWVNNHEETTTVGKIWIRSLDGSNNLTVQWFSPCSRGLCENEQKTVPFTGIPFNITLNGFTFSMSPVAGVPPGLLVVFAGTENLTFHRAMPSDYAGAWLNDDPTAGEVGKLWIDDNRNELTVTWFEACGASLCPHAPETTTYENEPFNVNIDNHTFRISLNSVAGDSISVLLASSYDGLWTNISPDPEAREALPQVELVGVGSTLLMDVYVTCGTQPCPDPSYTASGAFDSEPTSLSTPSLPDTTFIVSFDSARGDRLLMVLRSPDGEERILTFARQ